MKMKRWILILIPAAALLAAACRQGETPEAEPCTTVLREISVSALPETRSVLPEGDSFENRIREVTFAVYDSGRSLVTSAYTTDSTAVKLRMRSGQAYTLYALVNMGDQRARLPEYEADMNTFRYDSGVFTDFGRRGMPMAGSAHLDADFDGAPVCIGLRRLLAKVSFTVDHSALTQGVENCGIRHASVHIRQAARALYPFMDGGSMALSPADILSGDADREAVAPEHAYDLTSDTMVFYVPENAQGDLLDSYSDPWMKVPSRLGIDISRRCTYLEFQAVKEGADDGVSGNISFRFYLGTDNHRNFDVLGNRHYVVTLFLTWDNLFLKGSWKVARGDDWADNRRLSITERGSTTPVDVVLIQPGGSAEKVDLRFERGDGNRVLGARDIGYPLGWSLYIDGSPVTGNSGTLGNGTKWRYICNATEEYLRLSAPPSHKGGDPHTIQLMTPDGQVASPVVRTQVKPGLVVQAGGPLLYLGQRGILTAANAPENATIIWSHSGSGYRLTPRDDGTALVEVTHQGVAQFKAFCPQTGQADSTLFIWESVYLKIDKSILFAEPDGTPVPFTCSYYTSRTVNEANKLTVQSDYQETAYGHELSRALWEECLQPILHIEDTTFLNLVDGKICVVRLENGSKSFPRYRQVELSKVFFTQNRRGIWFIDSMPVTILSEDPFRYNYPLRTPPNELDYGLVSPWMYTSYTADKDILHSTIMADPDYCGIVVCIDGTDAEPALQSLFRWDGYQHTTYNLSNTTALTEHRGGLLTLHRYIRNRHSGERRLSDPYAQFNWYVAGAIGGSLEDQGDGSALVRGVFAGDYSATAFAGLTETAFIGTERSDGSTVSWNGGSATVSGAGGMQKPGEGVYTLSGNASADWASARQGLLPGLTLNPITDVLEEGNGYLTYQTYYRLYLLNEWVQ